VCIKRLFSTGAGQLLVLLIGVSCPLFKITDCCGESNHCSVYHVSLSKALSIMTNRVVVERGASIGHRTAIFITCDLVDLTLVFGYVDRVKA
jgi:hypothetical protein